MGSDDTEMVVAALLLVLPVCGDLLGDVVVETEHHGLPADRPGGEGGQPGEQEQQQLQHHPRRPPRPTAYPGRRGGLLETFRGGVHGDDGPAGYAA